MNPTVKYKKLDPRAQVPAYATPGAAAADLCACLLYTSDAADE